MKILVLNGSPRPNGNTAAMVDAFVEGAKENGHEIIVVPVCQKKIAGCLACEYCHTKGEGRCIQQDDMQEVYPVLSETNPQPIRSKTREAAIAIITSYTHERLNFPLCPARIAQTCGMRRAVIGKC